MSALVHLIYTSVATQKFDASQLCAMLEHAHVSNSRVGLTGMLLYSEGNFFQVLEGEASEVDKLFEKLSRDDRHAQLTVIIREPIPKRYFGDWSMGFSDISPSEVTSLVGMNDFFQDGSCFRCLDEGRAKKLLAAFAEGRWRGKLVGERPLKAKG